jgi:hypothetical protein
MIFSNLRHAARASSLVLLPGFFLLTPIALAQDAKKNATSPVTDRDNDHEEERSEKQQGWSYWRRGRPATRYPTRYLYNYGDWHVGGAGSSSLGYNPRRELVL